MPRSRALVVGASGFLGAHLARALLDDGWHVGAGIRPGSSQLRLTRAIGADRHLAPIELDLLDPSMTSGALERLRPSVVVNCAAYGVDYRERDVEPAVGVNVLGTARLIEAAAEHGAERFIHVGTAYEYGDRATPVREDSELRPRGVYASTKAAGSIVALERAAAAGLALVVVRPFSMYGPLEGGHKLAPRIVSACRAHTRVRLTEGQQVRDFVYVGDTCRACTVLAAMDDFPAGEVFNLGSGAGLTVRAFGDALAKLVSSNGTCLEWGALDYRPDEVMSIVADAGKAAGMLGWRAATSLDDGLRRTIADEQIGGS